MSDLEQFTADARPMTMLSEHFSLEEMIRSQTAVRKGIKNMPNDEQVACLRQVCVHILEPVRAHYGKPISVTSGFRCERLNKAIGGSGTSQHCMGQAVDFHVVGVPDVEVAKWIGANLKFDQLILEFPPEGWVHCSYDGSLRQQILTAKRTSRGTKYIPGLHP
jgi:zinc D-Ala-D-Ala carboxypeptidase